MCVPERLSKQREETGRLKKKTTAVGQVSHRNGLTTEMAKELKKREQM